MGVMGAQAGSLHRQGHGMRVGVRGEGVQTTGISLGFSSQHVLIFLLLGEISVYLTLTPQWKRYVVFPLNGVFPPPWRPYQ